MSEKIKVRVDAALYGVNPNFRYQLYEKIIGTLGEHVPEMLVDEVCRWVDYHARQVDDIQSRM